jgi:hypothetical protein
VAVSRSARHPARAVAGALATAAGGVLLGWAAASLARPVVAPTPDLLASGEHPSALRYALAVLTKDPLSISDIRPPGPIAARARDVELAEENREYEPLGLSFLGAGHDGPVGVYVYVVEETDPDEGTWRSPLVVTVIDGKVVRQRP